MHWQRREVDSDCGVHDGKTAAAWPISDSACMFKFSFKLAAAPVRTIFRSGRARQTASGTVGFPAFPWSQKIE